MLETLGRVPGVLEGSSPLVAVCSGFHENITANPEVDPRPPGKTSDIWRPVASVVFVREANELQEVDGNP